MFLDTASTLASSTQFKTMQQRRERTKGKKRQFRTQAEELQQALTQKEEEFVDVTGQLKGELAAFKTEIQGYQDFIHKLEGEIQKNYNFKLLADQNRNLKSDVEALRNQNTNLQKIIASKASEVRTGRHRPDLSVDLRPLSLTHQAPSITHQPPSITHQPPSGTR